jgi:hypothetical protein
MSKKKKTLKESSLQLLVPLPLDEQLGKGFCRLASFWATVQFEHPWTNLA